MIFLAGINAGCLKPADPSLHTGKVLAATCAAGAPSSTEVAVQLDNKDPLSFTWTNPASGSVYNNVVVTFNPVLRQAIGGSFTYTSVRTRNSTDTLSNITLAICITYPDVYLNNVTLK
ncbi:MAG TPA: hypothetical protein VNW95_04280 [Mucilaginibacter sp.]|nr:hypothetical protein [Mucilaginibacter sp.]